MKTKFLATAAIAVLLLNVAGLAMGDTRRARAGKGQAARLVSLLPASDGIAVFESKRFLGDGLATLLSANQPLLSQVLAKITEMENRTGIDLRKFDQVAVGVAMKQISAKEVDFEPVAIASGDINAGALIAVARLASNGTYRKEKIGERTVYIFTVKEALKNTTTKTTTSKIATAADKAINGLTKEIAVTALDRNTLVLGSLERVRATLDATSHVGADIIGLLSTKETGVVTFAFKTPGAMSTMLPLDNDELGANIDSIQYLAGSLDVAAAGTSLQLMARTKKPEQAQAVKETLDGLQMIGKAIFGSSTRVDQQVYGRMIKNAKFEVRANEVNLDLLVPQSDIDVLIAGIK